MVYLLTQKYKLISFKGHRMKKARKQKSPALMGGAFFQTRKFLGYYDLTLTATRTWNDNGHFKFRCKFKIKRQGIGEKKIIVIKWGLLKKKNRFFS